MGFLNSVAKWFRSRNITSHTVAGVVTLIAFTYISDSEARKYVTDVLHNHPKIIAFMTWVFVMWLKYSNAHSPIGVLEEVPKAEAKLSMQIETIKQEEETRNKELNKEVGKDAQNGIVPKDGVGEHKD